METRDGQRLLAGRYELGELLGSGGMADVHSAVDTRLQRPVAVKTLREPLAGRDDVRKRFDAEARAAARLAHPNAVAVFDTGEDEGTPFLVMERLDGETLADRMAEGGLDHNWLRRIGIAVLGALGAAHEAGLVHRDVKPGNILMTGDGSAKIGDFGIVKAVHARGLELDITGTGQLIGTPAYLAPERVAGAPATFLSDIYAMGVVLYEALCGKKPFTGPTPLSMALSIRSDDPIPLLEACPGIEPGLAAVVMKAMAREPEDRYQSAEEMGAALALADAPPADETQAIATTQAIPASQTIALSRDELGAEPVPLAPRSARRRKSRALPVVLLLLALLAAAAVAAAILATGENDSPGGSGSTGGSGGGENPEVVAELRAAANNLKVGDGPGGVEAARRLEAIATKLDGGGDASDDASALARDATQWRRTDRELGTRATALLLGALAKIPGAEVPAAAPAATPPPTQPPAASAGGESNGNGAGNGNGDGKDADRGEKPGKDDNDKD